MATPERISETHIALLDDLDAQIAPHEASYNEYVRLNEARNKLIESIKALYSIEATDALMDDGEIKRGVRKLTPEQQERLERKKAREAKRAENRRKREAARDQS